METAEIKNVEILATGTWHGSRKADVTLKDLYEMVDNFDKKIVDPWITLDHNDEFSDKVKNALKVASLGWVSSLRISANKLIADFKEVPKKIAELIQSGTLKKRSVEYYPKDTPYRINGKDYRNLLTAVTFFGAAKPAVNALADDFEVLMLANRQRPSFEGAVTLQSQEAQGGAMTAEEKAKAELEEKKLLRLKAQKLRKQAAKLEAEAEAEDEDESEEPAEVPAKPAKPGKGKMGDDSEDPDDSEELEPDGDEEDDVKAEDEDESMEDEGDDEGEDAEDDGEDEGKSGVAYALDCIEQAMDALKKSGMKYKVVKNKYLKMKARRDKLVKFKNKQLSKEAEAWVTEQMETGKILPKAQGMMVKNYLRFKADGKEELALFKEDVENRPEAAILREINLKDGFDGENKSGKISFKSDVELDNEIQKIMKEHKIDYVQATSMLEQRVAEHIEGGV